MDKLIGQFPDLMINISASPFDYDHDDDRKEVVRANVLKYKIPMVYCNAIGSQTEIVFDGGSLVFDKTGHVIKELKYFEEDFAVVAMDDESLAAAGDPSGTVRIPENFDKDMRVSKIHDPEQVISILTNEANIAQIHQALILGIRDYFSKMGFSKAILGSSGGIDSAVVLAIATERPGPGKRSRGPDALAIFQRSLG